MSSAKKRAVTSSHGTPAAQSVPMPAVELEPERRKKMMASVNIVEAAAEEVQPEWTYEGFEYREDEDLLNLIIPPKYQDRDPNANGARLIIQDIHVHNFKSYYGDHILGPLHKNLTMILGPNGSGKSNVIDSLLFVFGFRGSKIRTKKLTSLINSELGCNECRVIINFLYIQDIDEDKYRVIPKSAFKVGRTVHKDGTTFYEIDGKVVPQRDVTDFLQRAGIDLTHNRFLILQGEVEAIALMKPTSKSTNEQGMLEYIEDIVGTDRFVVPIAKLTHRLALLEVKASQYSVGMRRHQDQEEQFYPQMEAAVAYINTKNKLTFLHGLQLKHVIAKTLATKAGLIEELEMRKEVMDELHEEKREKQAELEQCEDVENELIRKYDEVTGKLHDAQKTEYDLSRREKMRNIAMKDANRAMAAAQKTLEQLMVERAVAEKAPEEARQKLEAIRAEVGVLRVQEERFQKIAGDGIMKYDAKSQADKLKKEKIDRELEEKSTIYNDLRAKLTEEEEEFKAVTTTAAQDEKRLEELVARRAALVAKLRADEDELPKIKPLYKKMHEELEHAKKRAFPLVTAEADLRRRCEQVKSELQELKNHRSVLTRSTAAQQAFQKLKDEGEFDGFIGRLGDLGTIHKNYDAVMSTIYTGKLDMLIVRSARDQDWAADYMQDHDIPRTTMLFLDHLHDYSMPGPSRGFPAPRLIDFIQCGDDIMMTKLWYSIVGDMVVCKNLEEAQKLDKKHKGKYRIVTEDATILDRSGNYTGGGKPWTGRMRITGEGPMVTDDETAMNKLRASHDQLVKDRADLQGRLNEQNMIIQRLSPDVPKYQSRIAEIEAGIPDLTVRIQGLDTSIAAQRTKIEEHGGKTISPAELKQKEASIEKLRKRVEKLRKEIEPLKASSDASQDKMNKMFQQMVSKNKEQATKTRERITKLEEEMAAEEATISNAPQHLRALDVKINQAQDDYTAKKEHSETLNEAESDIKPMIAIEKAVKEIKAEQAAIDAELIAAREKRTTAMVAYGNAVDKHSTYKRDYDQLDGMMDTLDFNLNRDTNDLEALEHMWLEPEDLDPHTKIVRADAEDVEEKLADDHVLMPMEVIEMIIPHKKNFEDVPFEMLDSEESKLAERIVEYEKATERFRREFDEKGISHYCTLKTLHRNECHDWDKYNTQVSIHRAKLNELRSARLQEFSDALSFLGTTTQMLYQMITNGGDASLKFVEEGRSSDPFDAGIKFSVRPAKKSWKLIENLSGGEKTLASLCFVFAMHHYRASPFYVMDEIDAALDLQNVNLIAHYIKFSERTRNAQFIIVSLRNQMFDVGSRLMGVYKVNGRTANIMVCPDHVENERAKSTVKQLQAYLERKPNKPQTEQTDLDGSPHEDEVDEEEEEAKRLAEKLKRCSLQKRHKRKLAPIDLKMFGLADDDDDDEEEENQQPRRAEYHQPAVEEDEEEEDEEEEYDQPTRLKPRKKVEESESDLSPTPSPPPQKKKPSSRGRAKSRRGN
ncbi:unnamed protein product [Caenorhabditis sp. 36 PRJEB53466]|nr:unnamed protein product [Caenorhabditis sp. 36 PRJEB53466]